MSYETTIEQVCNEYSINDCEYNKYEATGRFELVRSGFVNYLPSVPLAEHAFLYKQLLMHQQLSVLEQFEPAVLDKICCEGDAEECMAYVKVKPAIICTMHTGSYRVLNLYLLQQGVPFALVMGKTVIEQEGGHFQRMYSLLRKDRDEDLELIDAEQRNAGLQMLRALKKGKSLVLYLDGHSGAGTITSENPNSCVVDFLGQQLYVRKGIAYIAHAANVPIVPVVCYRQSLHAIRLRFYSLLLPNQLMNRDEFAIDATQRLYTMFAEVIRAYPEQWEGWMTIHQTAKIVRDICVDPPVSDKNGKNHVFNCFQFGIFKTGGMPFLLERQRYLFYPIDEELFAVLMRCTHAPVACGSISDALLRLLLQMGVVRYV